jgi:hypothetical protein
MKRTPLLIWSRTDPEGLPVATRAPEDVPVWESLGSLAAAFGKHPQYATRAWDAGFIRPVAYLLDSPCFAREEGQAGMRQYLGTISLRNRERSAKARAAVAARHKQKKEEQDAL